MWSATKPKYAGSVVRKWNIVNCDKTITRNSGLDSVKRTYSHLFGMWWKLHSAPDHGDLLEQDFPRLNADSKERTLWRVKGCYDYSAMLQIALDSVPGATHIVAIEDDVVLASNWV
eukprot:CAMPEP_0117083170 /NCGR_PEP_ID=MMETSP0472-20121206/58574_1 /TAXON_ID=693140 ORGANISM="Tiarina fusus, Strain LIS" /NCGR_SAMPLE_ID=MMETSP0472 /ASSEMBLY_ACC=CAM_ASM_000603 /LENGTH=115 /DNA_ID=CAMNT_0004811719 /DNA_START=468 /DNA_END=812 /DNA_ORIENTATION=+